MSKTNVQNSMVGFEVHELRDELSEQELARICGGYIGETEKNIPCGTRVGTASYAASVSGFCL